MKTKNINLNNTEGAHNFQMTGTVNLLVRVENDAVYGVLKALDNYATWNFARVALLDNAQLLIVMDFGRVPRQGKFVAPEDEDSPAGNLLTGDVGFIAQLGADENAVLQSVARYSSWMAMITLVNGDSLLINIRFNKVLDDMLAGQVKGS